MKKFLIMIMSLVMATILSSIAFAASDAVPNSVSDTQCTLSIPEVSYFDGAMNFSVDVQNNSLETTGTAYFALFNGDTLLGVSSKPATTIPAGSSTITGTVDMTEPSEGTSYTVKVFLWSENMVSLSPMQLVNYTYYKETVLELPAELYYSYNGTRIRFLQSATSSRFNTYLLSNTCKLYINDVESDMDLLDSYIGEQNTNVILRDKNSDEYYDEIRLQAYATAWVDEVAVNGNCVTISFLDQALTDNCASLTIDTSDSSVSYSVKDTDENYISLTDIENNNVLSIEYDVNMGFSDSSFYNITVSSDTVSGIVSDLFINDIGRYTCEIFSDEYTIADGMSPSIFVNTEYVFFISPYGCIAGAIKLYSYCNYCIIERVYMSASGEPTVRIIDKTGVKRTYVYAGDVDQATPSEDPTGIIKKVYDAAKSNTNNLTTIPLEDRVVNYTVTSSNQIKIRGDIKNIVKSTEENQVYTELTGALGSAVIDDTTAIIDISEWSKDFSKSARTLSNTSLTNGSFYSAVVVKSYGIDESITLFAAIYEKPIEWSTETPMAVVTKKLTTNVDGQTRTQLNVIENGEEKSLVCEDNSSKYNLAEGTAFMYLTGREGFVNDIVPILTVDLASSDKYDFYKKILANEADNMLSAKEMANTGIINSDLYYSGPVGSNLVKDGDHVEFIFAPVLNKTSSDITIGGMTYGTVPNLKSYLVGKVNAAAYYTDEAGENYAYESDASVVVYTQGNTKGYRVELGNCSSVVRSMISKSSYTTASYLDYNGTLVNLGAKAKSSVDINADPNTISFVLLKVFDDRVQAAYSIVLDDDIYPVFSAPTN